MKTLLSLLLLLSFSAPGLFAQWSQSGSRVYYNGGNVGIGTASPGVKLHLYNASNHVGVDVDTRMSNGSANVRLRNDVQMWALNVRGDLNDRFTIRDKGNNNKSVDVFQIEKGAPSLGYYMLWDGKTGFGTVPDERLHVKSIYKKALLKFENNYFTTRGDGGWKIGLDDQTFYIKDHNNNGIFQIKEDLTITMGISNRKTIVLGKLCVKPDANTACPDYVFEEDYRLRSLEELETYLQENKHLPGVKSAAEIQKEGSVDFIEMSYSLLEKVEELTLYTIEQQKHIQSLNEQNAALLERVQRLEDGQ